MRSRFRKSLAIVAFSAATCLTPWIGFSQERSSLPIPDPPFKGKIGKTVAESIPDYPQPVRAPKGEPTSCRRAWPSWSPH
jgi:hypothetical protein